MSVNTAMIVTSGGRTPTTVNPWQVANVTDNETTSVGQQVRIHRRLRGLSLRATAELAGLSPGFLSMVENGRRTLDRYTHIVALADVLQVTPGELTGQHQVPSPRASARAHDAIPLIRLAVLGITAPQFQQDRTPPPIDALAADVAELVELTRQCHYSRVIRRLPLLLTQLCHALDTGDRHEARHLLLRLYEPVCIVLCTHLGYHDLAYIAAQRARALADEPHDQAYRATQLYWRAWILTKHGAEKTILPTLLGGIDDIQDRRPPSVQRAIGGMHRLTAFCCARLGDDRQARKHFAAALGIARDLDDPDWLDIQFGADQLTAERTELAFFLGRRTEAVELAAQADLPAAATVDWRAFFELVHGSSLAGLPGRERLAITHLVRAEQMAPQYLHGETLLHRTVDDLLKRSIPEVAQRDLRGLAWRIGILT
jgi:transcriptional regulator with XRE-family HTH domain